MPYRPSISYRKDLYTYLLYAYKGCWIQTPIAMDALVRSACIKESFSKRGTT
jgi:hypothetical protein